MRLELCNYIDYKVEQLFASYSEDKHARILIRMLEDVGGTEDLYESCPKQILLSDNGIDPTCDYKTFNAAHVCGICNGFIKKQVARLKVAKSKYDQAPMCPCNRYGPELAAKLTWLALEAKGYI